MPSSVASGLRSRRDQLLTVAARLMAERGYHGTSIGDLGAAVGVSGPALYRHFASKQAVLGEMLGAVSQRLLSGAQERVDAAAGARQALEQLVRWHVRFATSEPHLIRVQDRDFASMADDDQRRVRQLQRRYVELWVQQVRIVAPAVDEERTRAAVHALFGLLNSTPYSGSRLDPGETERLLSELGMAVLEGLTGPLRAAG